MRVFAKMLLIMAMVIVVTPLQLLLLAFTRGPASMYLPGQFHRLMCAVLGLRVQVRGTPVAGSQAVFICNHLSHLDIPVIGSVLRACFVAKDDIRGWPVFGALARLQQTVFISRNARRAGDASKVLKVALDAGHRLVLFPEGTTSDGSGVLPFKSSIFAVLADSSLHHVALQPMTVELLAVDGELVAEGGNRDRYACYGQMRLLPHLLAFMQLSGATLRLSFHPPLPREEQASRKVLAALAYAAVSQAR